jgi:hypothetical protein
MARKRFQLPEVKSAAIPIRGWRNTTDQYGSLLRTDREGVVLPVVACIGCLL